MSDKPISRFDLIHSQAEKIRLARAAESAMRAEALGAKREPISEIRTAGLDEVIRAECARGGVAEGCTWVGFTSPTGEAKAKTR